MDRTNRDEASRPEKVDWRRALSDHDRWLRTVVLARLSGDRHGVDEVMQEVSMAAVAQKAPLADTTKVAPWLYRLAVTQSLLYRRKCGRARKLTDRFAEKFQPREDQSRTTDPLDWLLAEERRRMVQDALAKLPPRDAEILLLKYSEDWNYHDIAARLDISHAAVEARLHRARLRLRSELMAVDAVETQP